MSVLIEEQLKILQIMNQATNRMDLNVFAQKVGLTPDEAIAQVHELANKGLLRKVGGGFCLSDLGKTALKAYAQLPEGYEFNFYIQVGEPAGQTAKSIVDFYQIIRQINVASVEFHLNRGDFERWIMESLNDEVLAKQIGEIKTFNYHGEMLREELLEVIDEKYQIRDLL
jgi:DNA-binding Lrp family transcriptional regulator